MNMTKQYRAELSALKKSKKKVQRDFSRELRSNEQIKRLADRDSQKAARATHKALALIDKRIAILQGRLS